MNAVLPDRLLGVWAHPDDETYLSAALMRRVVAAGGHVTVVSATRGERGGDAAVAGPRLAARREHELLAAMAELGVTDVRVLGHPDGSCAARDPEHAADEVTAILRDVRPDVVVTFGPDGITGHPDHVAVGWWTTLAVRRLAESPQLLYATMVRDFVDRHRRRYPELPLTVEGDPVAVDATSLALRIVPSPDERRRKRAALTAHRSQTEPLISLVGHDRLHDWWIDETFREPTTAERLAEGHGVSTTSPDVLQASAPALAHSGTTSGRTGDHPIENRTDR